MMKKIVALVILCGAFSGGGYLYWHKTSKAQIKLNMDYKSAANALNQLNAVAQADISKSEQNNGLYQQIEGVLRFIEQPGFVFDKCSSDVKKALQAWKIIAFLFAKHKVTWNTDGERTSYLVKFNNIRLEVDGASGKVDMTFDNLDTTKNKIEGVPILTWIQS